MICPKCNTNNIDTARFCNTCGFDLMSNSDVIQNNNVWVNNNQSVAPPYNKIV